MSTINIIRKPTEKYANTITENENVSMILETKGTKWTRLSKQIKQVADMISSKDTGPSTILGSGVNFMEPFVEALENYKKNYSEASWCHQPVGEDVVRQVPYPFSGKPWDVDVSIAARKTIPDGHKVIVVGDIHSSIHSVREILNSWHERGIMTDDFVLVGDYHVVFLGDLVDRGGFGLDILHLVFRLKNSNPFGRVMILNGNHEDSSTYTRYGFSNEINTQLKDQTDINLVQNLLTYLPTVLFLQVNDSILQLNHGGIDVDYSPGSFVGSLYDYEFHGLDFGSKLYYPGLRWSDFNGTISGEQPSSRGGTLKRYGKDITDEYLAENGLSGIIRGHQDYHHIAILPHDYTIQHRDLDIIEEEDIGMYAPKPDHWSRQLTNGWSKVSLVDAFDDFSVITTSTAVRARDTGYHAYLEITNSQQDLKNEYTFMKDHVEVTTAIRKFFKSMDLEEHLKSVIFRKRIDDIYERKRWKEALSALAKHESGEVFFPILFLDAFLHKNY